MKDTGNYSNTIQFETEVYSGVYWIPINALGASRYTNEQMEAIVQLPPDEKKACIATLYEAIQLFQVSGFRGVYDNANHQIGNVLWQTHKNAAESLRTNEGCCATDTNWLAFFLKGRYNFAGSFCYANLDGNGHITNYIYHEGQYYFIDMMMCRRDSQAYLCPENGRLSDLLASEWSGFLYRAKKPLDFCHFHMDRCRAKGRDVPFGFYLRKTDEVHATGLEFTEGGTVFYVPEEENPEILFIDQQKTGDIRITKTPEIVASCPRCL